MADEGHFRRNLAIVAVAHLVLIAAMYVVGKLRSHPEAMEIMWLDGGSSGGEDGAPEAIANAAAPEKIEEQPPPPPPEPRPEPLPPPPEPKQPLEKPEPDPDAIATATPTPTPKPATPKPATPEPTTPKPATPKPATPKPATPKPATPKPATPKPATPKAPPKITPKAATEPTAKVAAKTPAKAAGTPKASPKPDSEGGSKTAGASKKGDATPGGRKSGSGKVVGDGAPAGRKPGGGTGTGEGSGTGAGREGGGSKEAKYGWYFAMLKDRFYAQWVQPMSLVRDGAQCVATLKIRVHRDGTISNRAIVHGSGSAVMDDSVLTAANQLTEIEPLPAGLTKDDFVDLTVAFELSHAR